MGNAFRDYATHGPADSARARAAAVTDLGIGIVAGILLWPFPVARVAFEGLMGSPALGWAVHVPVLLVFALLASWAYGALCTVLVRRTVGMYFADLGFSEVPAVPAAVSFAGTWVAAGMAGLMGSSGPACRAAARSLRSTRE